MVRPIYVTQAGRVINFADNATDDQIQAYVQQNFPAQPQAQAPAQPKYSDAGLGSFLTTGFTESYSDIPGGISSLATADETSLTRASDYAKKTAREALGIKEGEEWTIPQYAAYLTGQVGGFLMPVAGEAAVGAKILSGAGKLANLARGVGAVTEAASGAEKLSMGAKAALAVPSLAQTGAVQANAAREKINQQRADGMVISPEQQLLTQRMNFAIGLAERVPLERFAGPLTGLLSKVPAKYAPVAEKIIASRLSRVAGTSFAEASQEVLSGIASDLVEYGVYNPDVQIGQDIVSNAAGGGFAGGMVEGILQVAAGRRAGRAKQLQADVQREAEEGRTQARLAEIEAGVKAMVDNKVSGLLDVKAYTVNKTPGDPNSPKITIRELSHKGTPVSLFTDMSVAQEAVNEYKKRTNADVKITTGKVDDYFGAQPKVQVKDTPAFEGTSRLGDRLRARQEEAPFKGGLSATIKQGENVDQAQPVGDKFLLPDQIRSQYETLSANQTERNAILKTPERLEANAMNIGIEPNELKIALTEQNKADAPTIKQLKPLYGDIASRAQQNVATPTADPLSSLNPESNNLSMASTVSLNGEPIRTLFPKRKGVSYETLNKFTSGTKFEPLTPEQVETFQSTPPEYAASYELPAQPGTTQAAATDVNADLNETPKGAVEWRGIDTLSAPVMEPGSGDTSTVINKPSNRPVPKVTKEYEARAQKMAQVLGDSVDARVKALNMPFVAARLRDHISGKTVTDVPNPENIPDAVRDRRTPRGMATTISPEKVLIDLATSVWGQNISVEDMTKKVIETLNHEIIHAVYGVNALTPAEQRILSKSVRSTKMLGKKYTYLDMAQASYGPTFQKSVNDGTMTQAEADAAVEEEAVAEMFREWSKNPKAAPQQAKGLLNRILHFIRALFHGLKSASHHDVFRKIESGEVGNRPRGNPKMSPSRFAIPPEYLRNNINYVETPEEGKNKTENFIPDNMDAAKSVKAYQRLDEARRMFPNPLANPIVWTDNLSYAYNKADGTLMPPVWASRMANDVNSWATWQKGLTADQLSGVDDGFSSIDQIGAEYANGNATPEFTGTLLFWTYLSRMQSSFPHESGFLDMAETVQPFITKAVNGTFTADPTLVALTATNSKALKTAQGFPENALPHEMAVPGRSDLDDYFIATRAALPTDSPGQSATSNINSFGRDFLAKMSEKAPGENISKLKAVHNLFADRRLSGPEVRRQFHRIRDDASLGFDNKILSFAILLSGRKDVLIMDRIQINQMFGGGQTNKIYDDIHSLFDGPRGLAVYEALERGLALKMNDLYTAVGRPQDASLGRYHWESWIRSSGQIVAHPTLQALVNLARGTPNPFLGVASAEGRYHRGMFGVQYMRMPNGKSEFIYTAQDGNEYAIPKNQLDEILDWDKLRKKGAIPPWFPGVSTFEGGVSSWRDYPGVNINLVDSEVARNGVLIRNGRANQATSQPANAAQAANAARLARIRTAYDASNRARWDFGRRPVDGKPHARIPESYERTDRGLGTGNVARYEAKDGVKSIFGQAKVSTPDFLELAPTPENAAKFHAAISAAKAENTHGAAVYLYEDGEYANMRLFLTEDGGAGFALKGDDIVSVFNRKSSPHRYVSIPALHLAIQLGGRKLDGFDTVLPGLYQQSGMSVASRTKFADLDGIRPTGWSPQTFAEFNGGYPDVVYMVFDPTNWAMYKPTDGALFTSKLEEPYAAAEEAYNLATAAQSAAVYVEPDAKPKAPRNGPRFSVSPEHQEVESTAYVEQMRPNVYKVDVQEGLLTRFVKGMFGEGHKQGTFMEALRQNLVDRRSRIKYFEGEMQGNEEMSGYISMEFADRAGHFGFAAATEGPPVLDMSNNDPDTMTVRISESPDNIKNIYELLTDGPLGPDGKKQSLGNVFFDYAIAKRGSVLEDDGFETPLDDQFIADAIRVGESNPKVMEAYAMYQRYNKRLMEAALKSGYLTQEQFEKFTNGMNYFSFYREFGDIAQVPGVGTKMANDLGIVPYRGSKLGNLINDPILMMVNNTVFWTAAIMKTVAVRKTFKNLNAIGEARILAPGEQIPAGWQPEVMYYKDRGETHQFVVKDYLLAQSLGSSDTFDAPGWLKLLGLPTKGLREAITRDPVFIARNLMRDTISAWGLTGENIIPVIDTLKGMKKALLNDTSMRSLMLRGVTGGYDEASRGAEGITKFIKNQSALKKPKIEYLTDPKQIRDVIWRGLGRISDASDAATRIAVYDRAREQGASEYAAAYRALKIMNFSRQGRWSGIRYLTALYPFINARIQGTDLWMRSIAAGGRTLVGKGSMEDATMGVNVGKSLLVRGAMMAALSMLLEAYNSQDENYLGTEDYIKDSNLLIPTFGLFGPDGPDYWAWPQAFEFGLMFSTIPRHIYQHMAGRGEARKDVNLFTAQFASTFGLNPTPQIINPIYEVLYNKSFFTGQPVISEGMARLDPSMQYTDKTSGMARMLGEIPLNYDPVSGQMKGFSPAMIDHLIKGYGGPMGAYLLVASDVVANGVNIGPPRLPNTSITEAPIIRSFLIDTKTRNPQAKADAYELYQMVDEVNRTSSRLKAMGDVEAYMEYRQENLPIIQRKKQVMSMVKSLNDLQARRRMLERNKTMTEDEKIAEIKRLRDLEVRLTARVGELNAALR